MILWFRGSILAVRVISSPPPPPPPPPKPPLPPCLTGMFIAAFGCPDYEVPLSKNCSMRARACVSARVRVCLVKCSTFIAIHSFHPCISTDEKTFLDFRGKFYLSSQFNEADQRVQCACLSLMLTP